MVAIFTLPSTVLVPAMINMQSHRPKKDLVLTFTQATTWRLPAMTYHLRQASRYQVYLLYPMKTGRRRSNMHRTMHTIRGASSVQDATHANKHMSTRACTPGIHSRIHLEANTRLYPCSALNRTPFSPSCKVRSGDCPR